MVAAKHKNAEAAALLIAHGADANLSSVLGRNPLNVAALHDSIEVAHLLLTQTNVDVNARGQLCPLAIASRQGYLDFVQLLIRETKITISQKCIDSAKNMASLNQNVDVLNYLNSIPALF